MKADTEASSGLLRLLFNEYPLAHADRGPLRDGRNDGGLVVMFNWCRRSGMYCDPIQRTRFCFADGLPLCGAEQGLVLQAHFPFDDIRS